MFSAFITLGAVGVFIVAVLRTVQEAGRYQAEAKRAREERDALEALAKAAKLREKQINGMTDEELRKFLLDNGN